MSGYPTTDPCRVCGGWDENEVEPRFGYVVCAEHADVPPAEVEAVRARREASPVPDVVDEVIGDLITTGNGFEPEFYQLMNVRHRLTSAYVTQRPAQSEIDSAVAAGRARLAEDSP